MSKINFIIKDEAQRHFKLACTIVPFYPMIFVLIATPLFIHFGQPWIGFVVGAILLFLFSTWSTCIFGLLNVISILGMFIVCAVSYLK